MLMSIAKTQEAEGVSQKSFFAEVIRHSPWQILFLGRAMLIRFHISNHYCSALGLCHFGDLTNHEATFNTYMSYFRHFKANRNKVKGFVALELGPGDSLSSVLFTHAVGGSFCYLIDVDMNATRKVARYLQMANYLGSQGLSVPNLSNCKSLEDVLSTCRGSYGTSGFKSLQKIPSESADFIFSTAVLEHVEKNQVYSTLKELHRICKKDGICVHVVDLRDHLSGSLNHLKIPESLWETTGMNANFINRLLYPDFIALFKKAGFSIIEIKKRRWRSLPIPKECFAAPYRNFSEDDLSVRSFTIVLKT
jgi:hypothetical protein